MPRRQAATVEFDRRRLATARRAGWLSEPIPGVLVLAGSAPTWHQRLMMVTLAAGGCGVASHRAAARLHHLDGFNYARMAAVEVSVPRSSRVDLPGGVVHHVTALTSEDRRGVRLGAALPRVRRDEAAGRGPDSGQARGQHSTSGLVR